MTNLKLWGVSTSRTLRPIWVAEELGLSYDLVPIGPRTGATQTPDYLSRNPKGKVPYAQDGDLGLSESVAICRYLIAKYGRESDLAAPVSVEERARSDEWCCFILSELDETSLYVIRRHQDLHEIYGDAPVAVASAREYCAKQFRAAAKLLVGPYVQGDRFGLPDILIMSCIIWADRLGIETPVAIQNLRDKIAERPAYQKALTINQQKAT